jgi:hypothetical protein
MKKNFKIKNFPQQFILTQTKKDLLTFFQFIPYKCLGSTRSARQTEICTPVMRPSLRAETPCHCERSEAIQCGITTSGLPRRFAPRNDSGANSGLAGCLQDRVFVPLSFAMTSGRRGMAAGGL